MARTKYLTEERAKSLGIDLSVYPSAGPNPNGDAKSLSVTCVLENKTT